MNRSELINQLEDKIMEFYPKNIGDYLLTNYIKLIKIIDNNFKISLKESKKPILIIRHKSFEKHFECYISKNNLFLNKKKISPESINEKLLDELVLTK